jgi:hypothetical protein
LDAVEKGKNLLKLYPIQDFGVFAADKTQVDVDERKKV